MFCSLLPLSLLFSLSPSSVPSFYRGALQTVSPFSRPIIHSIAKEILVKKGKEDDESIHSFVSRRLGKEVRGRRTRKSRVTY